MKRKAIFLVGSDEKIKELVEDLGMLKKAMDEKHLFLQKQWDDAMKIATEKRQEIFTSLESRLGELGILVDKKKLHVDSQSGVIEVREHDPNEPGGGELGDLLARIIRGD